MRMPRRLLLCLCVGLAAAACSNANRDGGPASAPQPKPPQATQLPTGAQSANEPEDGQWLMPAKNYASTRYSGLEEINAGNVKTLKVAWTFSTGVNRGHEAAPLVVGDTMYVVTPYPNILYALDLKNPGTLKWKYEPDPAAAAQGVAGGGKDTKAPGANEVTVIDTATNTVVNHIQAGDGPWGIAIGNSSSSS